MSFLQTLWLRNPRVRRIVAVILCAYPVYDFCLYSLRVPSQRLIDLFVQYVAARVLAAQGDIYSFRALRLMADQIGGVRYGSAFSNLLLAYTHPPSDTFFDLRWTLFNWPTVKLIYAIQTPLLYLGSLLLVWFTLRAMTPRVLHWLWPVLLFALFGPTRSSLGLGQQDILLFFLAVLTLWAFSRGHDLLAALPLAVATLIKITPGVFLLYFLWKREWRMVLYTGVLLLAIVLLGLPVIGVSRWVQFVTQIFPSLSTGTSYFDNQSLGGLINRLLLDPVYAQGLQSAPSVGIVRALTMAGELLLVGLALYFTRGRLARRGSLALALEFSIWLTIQPILSPIAWDHYFTWLLLPATVLLAALLNARLSLARAAALLLLLAAALWLANFSTQSLQTLPGLARSPLLYGSLLILMLLFYLPSPGRRESPELGRRGGGVGGEVPAHTLLSNYSSGV